MQETVNAILYYASLALVIPYVLIVAIITDLRLSFSESYRTEYYDDLERRSRRRRGKSAPFV